MNNGASLVERVREGDKQAEVELVNGYVNRLLELARSRLRSKLTRRVDPEDVVQSAYRSFFRRAREGHYVLSEPENLWRLLATIVVNKVHKTVRRHTAAKRNVDVEEDVDENDRLTLPRLQAISREPTPLEASILIEEMESLMQEMTALQRQILELRLQGFSVDDTTQECQCSHRTVYRAMESAKAQLENRLSLRSNPSDIRP